MARDTTTNPGLLAAALAMAGTVVFAPAGPAAAAPLPRLEVDRASDAADCPDASALAAAVEQHMQRPALDPAGTDAAAPTYQVRILRSADGYSATLQAGDLTRQFSDAGSRCDEIAGAIALTLAILLDSEPAVHTSSPPATVERKPRVRRSRATAVKLDPAQRTPAPPAPGPRPVLRGIAVDFGTAGTFGFLAPLAVAFTGELSFRFPSVSFGLGALFVPPRTVELVPGVVRLWLAAAPMRLCTGVAGDPERTQLSVCAQSLAGIIHGTGSGFAPDRAGTAPWLAFGGTGLAEGPIAGPFGWTVRATCAFPILASAFTVDQSSGPGSAARAVTVFSSWPVNLLLGAGLRVAIR